MSTHRTELALEAHLHRMPASDWYGWGFLAVGISCWTLGAFVGGELAVMMLMVIGLLCAMYGVLNPAVGLFGVGLMCTMDALAKFMLLSGGLLRWNTFNYLLAVIIVLNFPFLIRLRNLQCAIWQITTLVLAAQLIYSSDRFLGANQLLNAVSFFGILVYFVRTADNQRLWYWLGIVNGAVTAWGGLILYFRGFSFIREHLNVFTMFPITAMWTICIADHYATEQKRGQVLLILLAAVNFLLVVLTGSRGGLLISSCCMAFLLVRVRGTANRLFVVGATAVLIVLVAVMAPDLVERTINRVYSLFDFGSSLTGRTSGRWDLALGGWYIFLEHPWGVGTGGFQNAWIELDLQGGLSGFNAGQEVSGGAHSAWIRVLVENGLPGIVLLATFVLSFTFSGFRQMRRGVPGMLSYGVLATAAIALTYVSREITDKGPWLLASAVVVLFHRRELKTALDFSLGRSPSPSFDDPHTRGELTQD